MRSILRILSLFLLTVTLAPGCNPGNQTPPLRFNLEKGKAYAYDLAIDMSQEVGGQKMDSRMQFAYRMDVVGDSAGIKTINATYERLGMQMNAQGKTFVIDTDRPSSDSLNSSDPNQMMQGMYAALKGKSFGLTVDAEGNVLSVTGMSAMVQNMVNEIKVDDSMRDGLRQMFLAQFNDEIMKQTFAPAFSHYPNKRVEVGDKWQKQTTAQLGASLTMNTTYTVKAIQNGAVTVSAEAAVAVQNVNGTMTGEYVMDAKTGLLLSGNFRQSFGAPLSMKAEGRISGKAL